MREIFAKRLKNARIMEGLSMEKLAESAGISKQMISKYEKGLSLPDSSVLIRLAKSLHQKADYFFTPFKIELGPIEFRKKSSLGRKQQDRIKQKIHLLMEHYLELENILSIKSEFENPLGDHSADSPEAVERAAESLRDHWELGRDPIYSIISLLEEHEVKIIEMDEDLKDFDGLAAYMGNKYPAIVINKNMPVERKRFTLLHELAHLLLDINQEEKKEKLCHRFAGAVLLPREVVLEQYGKKRSHIAYHELFAVQKRFGISATAIIYRLNDSGVIRQERQRQFFMLLNKNKILKEQVLREKYQGEETSERYEKLVYRALVQEQISLSKASSMLGKSVEHVRENLAVI